jgi:hypothetical protein
MTGNELARLMWPNLGSFYGPSEGQPISFAEMLMNDWRIAREQGFVYPHSSTNCDPKRQLEP